MNLAIHPEHPASRLILRHALQISHDGCSAPMNSCKQSLVLCAVWSPAFDMLQLRSVWSQGAEGHKDLGPARHCERGSVSDCVHRSTLVLPDPHTQMTSKAQTSTDMQALAREHSCQRLQWTLVWRVEGGQAQMRQRGSDSLSCGACCIANFGERLAMHTVINLQHPRSRRGRKQRPARPKGMQRGRRYGFGWESWLQRYGTCEKGHPVCDVWHPGKVAGRRRHPSDGLDVDAHEDGNAGNSVLKASRLTWWCCCFRIIIGKVLFLCLMLGLRWRNVLRASGPGLPWRARLCRRTVVRVRLLLGTSAALDWPGWRWSARGFLLGRAFTALPNMCLLLLRLLLRSPCSCICPLLRSSRSPRARPGRSALLLLWWRLLLLLLWLLWWRRRGLAPSSCRSPESMHDDHA